MYEKIRGFLSVPGLTQTDIDEANNRIVVGGKDRQSVDRLLLALQAVGAPSGMIDVFVIPPTVTSASLSDPVSPRLGGLRIFGLENCTLGFNARTQNVFNGLYDPTRYFITNSHCTSPTGAADGISRGVIFGQPDPAHRVGVEAVDPALRRYDPYDYTDCRPDRQCRYSDAALVQYDAGVSDNMGRLADVDGPFPYNIFGNFYVDRIDNQPGIGAFVYKIGATTGTTGGNITHTCVNVTQYRGRREDGSLIDRGVDMLCQDQATLELNFGDSGSAVYRRNVVGGDVTAIGLLWGSAPVGNYGESGRFADLTATYSPVGWFTGQGELGYAISENKGVYIHCNSLNPAPGC